MSKGNVNFKSNQNEYYTPKWIVDKFGKFDYDPATTTDKANEFGVKYYGTEQSNGLTADWTSYNRIWINPPFKMKYEFLQKAVDTYKNKKIDIYIYCSLLKLLQQKSSSQLLQEEKCISQTEELNLNHNTTKRLNRQHLALL